MFAYSDAYWAGDVTVRKSNSGLFIAINGIPAAWKSQKQVGVVLSFCAMEYIAISECTKLLKWAHMLLKELGLLEEESTVVFEDNTETSKWTKSEEIAKPVDVQYHFGKGEVSNCTLKVLYSRSEQMLVDHMIKVLTSERVRFLRDLPCIDRVVPRRESKGGCCA